MESLPDPVLNEPDIKDYLDVDAADIKSEVDISHLRNPSVVHYGAPNRAQRRDNERQRRRLLTRVRMAARHGERKGS